MSYIRPSILFAVSAPYYVLVRKTQNTYEGGIGRTVAVKEGAYFRSIDGLSQPWGTDWLPIAADSLYAAKQVGRYMTLPEGYPFPHHPQGLLGRLEAEWAAAALDSPWATEARQKEADELARRLCEPFELSDEAKEALDDVGAFTTQPKAFPAQLPKPYSFNSLLDELIGKEFVGTIETRKMPKYGSALVEDRVLPNGVRNTTFISFRTDVCDPCDDWASAYIEHIGDWITYSYGEPVHTVQQQAREY